MSNLRDIVRQLIKDNEELYSVVCKVVNVNRDKRVCKVEPKNGDAAIFNVRLQSKVSFDIGLVLFPALESDVTVTFLSKELAFVSQTSEIEDVKLDIGEFSLFIDAENFNKSVKNIVVNSIDTKINSTDYELTGENTKFTISQIFEVISAGAISLEALSIALDANNIDITGITTITGATTVNGVTTLNGAATISGAATMSAAVTMGGGANGGIPKGASLITELSKIITEVNKIRTALVGWTPISHDGGAALKARVGGLTALATPSVGSITNLNAKH